MASAPSYEWLYGQPHINWTATEADDPERTEFQLDPNNRQVSLRCFVLCHMQASQVKSQANHVIIITHCMWPPAGLDMA